MSRYRPSNFMSASVGLLLTMVALFCSNVTLARGSYAGLLLTAMACTVLAVVSFAVPFVRGPLAWRIVVAVLATPLLAVVADFARRAPHVFGPG